MRAEFKLNQDKSSIIFVCKNIQEIVYTYGK